MLFYALSRLSGTVMLCIQQTRVILCTRYYPTTAYVVQLELICIILRTHRDHRGAILSSQHTLVITFSTLYA